MDTYQRHANSLSSDLDRAEGKNRRLRYLLANARTYVLLVKAVTLDDDLRQHAEDLLAEMDLDLRLED